MFFALYNCRRIFVSPLSMGFLFTLIGFSPTCDRVKYYCAEQWASAPLGRYVYRRTQKVLDRDR